MASLGNYGIMTLSRGPYNELDKMSLFQDLKLKRRKVDSRCSSDGESLADTSTSSPDLPPLSPKVCDASLQQGNTNQMNVASHQSQSKANSPSLPSSSPPETTSSEDQEAIISTLSSNKRDSPLTDGRQENPSTTTNDHHSHLNNKIHPNGSIGNNNSGSGISVIIENRPRSHSPTPSSPIRSSPVNTLLQQTLTNPSTHSSESNLHQQHVTVLVTPPRIKAETHHLMHAMTRKLPPVSNIPPIENHSLPITAPMSGLSQLQHHHQINQVQIPFTSTAVTTAMASGFKRNIAGQISPNHPHHHHHHHYPIDVQQRIKRERSPNSHLSIISQQNNQMRQQPLSSHQIPISSAAAAVFHGTPLQMRGAQGLREATMLFRIKNESQMAMPTGFLPSSPPQRMMWGPQARINGVKPEVIGGPMPALRQQASPQQMSPQQMSPKHNSNSNKARSTPTVIMGESCGVRTMVWGFEPVMSSQNQHQQQPHQHQQQQQQVQSLNSPVQSPPGTSQSSNHSTSSNLSSNNEEAAHLLLSLGQGVRPIIENRARAINRAPHALNMERLWAGDYSQLPAGQQMHALNLSAQQQQQQSWMGQHQLNKEHGSIDEITNEEDDQPLVCMICEDKATGLHYGIITCEGCKGFFKRTVQNRRVYTCVADGTCEITKAQRNRCQYCRFKKCIEQGMVLQAVREDRMPGGRNSGAVYNLYKVKYKKHKKNNTQKGNGANSGKNSGNNSDSKSTSPLTTNVTQPHSIKQESLPPPSLNGNILKTALTNPSEINHLRHRLDNAVSSSRDRSISFENALSMIQALIDCDAMEDIATLPHFSQFLEDKSEISDKLCNIGDSIVHKLVSWTKKLPFYLEIPVEIHTKLLTDKWHEILVLTTATYQAMHGRKFTQPQQTPPTSIAPDKHDPEFVQEVNAHLQTLQTCLTTLMGHSISMEQLKLDVGLMVEKMTQITIMFRRIKLRMEEYVCLKVYILLNREVELESIQERYIQVLRSYLQHTSPHNPGRLSELLAHIPEIQTAANLLLESKMFYVPFVLNSATIR